MGFMKYLEPYKSCSLFGALRYFANIKNVVCLVHGPSGCTYFNRTAVYNMNGYFNSPTKVEVPKIYCTDFDEKDAVFGGHDKIVAAAEELIEKFSPSALFLFNCCVSEIIGEDIDDIAENVSERYKIPVVPVHSAGFKGDHRYGMKMAGELLLEFFMKEKHEVISKKVNILGEFDYFNRAIVEAKNMLELAGVKEIAFIPGRCSVADLNDAPNACLNLITCQNASRHLAEKMKEKFNIPYIGKASDFYGVENCYSVYNEIFDFFNSDKTYISELYEKSLKDVKLLREQLEGSTAVVIAGTRRALGYSQILYELGVTVEFLFSECDGEFVKSDQFMRYSSNIMCNEYPDNIGNIIQEKKPDFILSTLPELIAPEQNMRRPLTDFAGFSGVTEMGKYLLNAKKYGYDTAYALINKR